MSVTLQVRLNGGAAASGAITAAEGDVVQLTAASKAGWAASPLPRWEIVDSPPDFACPAGWSTDGTTGVFYYEHASNDPPSFTITHWGKFILALSVTDAGTARVDRATGIKVLSPSGLEDIGRGERELFGGTRKRWVKPLQSLTRYIERGLGPTMTSAVALADSSETITLSAGRRRAAPVSLLTASRTKTLSTTGATLGDLWTIERTDRSRHRLTIADASGAVIGQLDRPGRFTARYNGTAWEAETPLEPGRVFTPHQFGFKFCDSSDAAQITLNTAAINAMFAALSGAAGSDPNYNAKVLFPGGDYFVDDEIRIVNTGGFGALTIEGEYGGTYGLAGTRILASSAFPNTGSKAVVKTVGVCGLSVRNLEVRAQSRAKYAWWASIEDGYESCSGHVYDRCSFAEARDVSGAAQFAAGPEAPLGSGATQVDNIRYVNCNFLGIPASTANANGWQTNVASNTKNFAFVGCVWSWNARHIDWLNASGNLVALWASFESSKAADIRIGSSQAVILSANSERSAKAFEGSSADASLTAMGWQWNGTSLNDGWEVGSFRGALTLRGNMFINYRALRTVTAVDTAADTLNVSADPDGGATSMPEDRRCRFMAGSGGTLPAPFVEGKDYKVINVDADTIQLEDWDAPAGAIDITSSGSGTFSLISESRIAGPDDLTAGSLVSEGNLYFGSVDHAPLANSGVGNDVLGTAYATGISPSRIFSRGDRGGVSGRVFALREVQGYWQDVAPASSYAGNATLSKPFLTPVYEGRPCGDGYVSCYLMSTDNLKAFGATTVGQAYIQLPPKTQLRRVVIDVEQALAAPGLTDAKIGAYDAAGAIGDIIAQSDCDVTGTYGLAAGDLGANMTANLVQGGYMGAGGWAGFWNMLVRVVTTGANLSALTAGRVRVYVTTARYA